MRNKILSFLFVGYLLLMLLINVFTKDIDISYDERRKLTQCPIPTVEKLLDGRYFKAFDKYALDQFVGRDFYRMLKAKVNYNIWQNIDNNGYYIIGNHLFKKEYPYNKDGLKKTLNKINYVYDKYLENNNVFYAVIPDKNYFVSDNYLKLNYNQMFKKIDEELNLFHKIDFLDKLSLKNYYYTDPHWKQETLNDVVQELITNMQGSYQEVEYTKEVFNNFYGSYASQSGIKRHADKLTILKNDVINQVDVKYLEDKNFDLVYNVPKYKGMDPYDIYLNGATALIDIVNNDIDQKELIVFRDSFGSSIIPLLIPYYHKITVVDLRYFNSNLLSDYIDFANQDVLFLYSTLIYNTDILK